MYRNIVWLEVFCLLEHTILEEAQEVKGCGYPYTVMRLGGTLQES